MTDGKYTKSCSVKQFSCGDNSCISFDKICDFRHDCLNGQDESNITCGKTKCYIRFMPPASWTRHYYMKCSPGVVKLEIYINIKKRCGVIANEKNLHKKPNDTELKVTIRP